MAQAAAQRGREGERPNEMISAEANSDEDAHAEDFRAVAPPVLSFASGRRR
jgi:hypothetical protein